MYIIHVVEKNIEPKKLFSFNTAILCFEKRKVGRMDTFVVPTYVSMAKNAW